MSLWVQSLEIIINFEVTSASNLRNSSLTSSFQYKVKRMRWNFKEKKIRSSSVKIAYNCIFISESVILEDGKPQKQHVLEQRGQTRMALSMVSTCPIYWLPWCSLAFLRRKFYFFRSLSWAFNAHRKIIIWVHAFYTASYSLLEKIKWVQVERSCKKLSLKKFVAGELRSDRNEKQAGHRMSAPSLTKRKWLEFTILANL